MGLIHPIKDWAFINQLVRPATTAKVLNRRKTMTSKSPKKKTVLEQELEEALKEKGSEKLVAQLQRQIQAEKTGLSSQELYLGRPCILSKRDKRF